MDDFDKFLNEQLKDPVFKREWEASEYEFAAAQAEIDAQNQNDSSHDEAKIDFATIY